MDFSHLSRRMINERTIKMLDGLYFFEKNGFQSFHHRDIGFPLDYDPCV